MHTYVLLPIICWIHIPSFNYDKPITMKSEMIIGLKWWLIFYLSVSMFIPLRSKVFFHSKELRLMLRKVQRNVVRVKNSEKFLKLIKMMKIASYWVLGSWQDNEQQRPYIKDVLEATWRTSWLRMKLCRVCIRMMKDLDSEFLNVRITQKDSECITWTISTNWSLIVLHFPYAATINEGIS